MENISIKKGIAITGIIAGSLFTYDASVLTDTEVDKLRAEISMTARQDFIFENIGKSRENILDISKVSPEEYLQDHIDILEKMGEKLSPNDKEKNLAKRIRGVAKKRTSLLSQI